MNISPVSAGSKACLPTYGNGEIKMLEKQKEQLEKQIENTKASNMDPESKQEAIKLLQEQIRQIETEILQKRNENLAGKPDADSNDKKNSSAAGGKPDSSEAGSDLSGLNDLVAASSSFSRARIIDSVKNSLEGKGNILAQEIKTDEARGVDPKAKRAELTDIKVHGQMLDQKMGEALQTSQRQAEGASQSGDTGDSSETGKEADGITESAGSTVHEENEEENETKENDPLTWFLENKDRYKKVDVLA